MCYIDPRWVDIFKKNQLATFDEIWQLELANVDEGNHGRGGHSFVSRCEVLLPDGKKETLYIKRQQNYRCFDWRNPFSGKPTFEREFSNWQRFQKLGLPTYELLYFAKRWYGKKLQAILITRELPAKDLASYVRELEAPSYKPTKETFRQRKKVTEAAAQVLRQMHQCKLRHGHIIPKHIFVGDLSSQQPQSYVIDLENMHKSVFKRATILQDIGRLARHIGGGSMTDKIRFYKAYLAVNRLNSQHKRLWRAIQARAIKS